MMISKFLTIGALSLFLVGCTPHSNLQSQKPKSKPKPQAKTKKSSSKLQMHGVPGWVASGAKIEKEPKPQKPIPGFVPLQRESGPIRFEMEMGKDAKANAKRKPSKRNLKSKERS